MDGPMPRWTRGSWAGPVPSRTPMMLRSIVVTSVASGAGQGQARPPTARAVQPWHMCLVTLKKLAGAAEEMADADPADLEAGDGPPSSSSVSSRFFVGSS